MLRIRLRRMGKKKQPSYRVVVADSRAPRDGAFVEVVGYYNPRTEPATVEIDAERAKLWLARGAQPSERVARLLAAKGVIDAPALPNRPKGTNKKGAAEAPPAAQAASGEPAEPAAEPSVEEPAASE